MLCKRIRIASPSKDKDMETMTEKESKQESERWNATKSNDNKTYIGIHSLESPVSFVNGNHPFSLMESGIMDEDDYEMVTKIQSAVGVPLAVLGCLLNILAVIVYFRMPPTFINKFLIGLQIKDTIGLVLILYPLSVVLISDSNAIKGQIYQHYAKYINNYVYPSVQRANVFSMGLLSVNRCIVMLAPLNGVVKRLFTVPWRILVVIQVITFITSIYILFKIKVNLVTMPDNSERYILVTTDEYKNNQNLFDNVSVINSVLFTYIPAISSFVSNVCMIIGLVIVSRKRKKFSEYDHGASTGTFFQMGNQKTMLVLVYSGISFLLLMPMMSFSILRQVVPGFTLLAKEHYLFICLGHAIALCDILRSTMGFFVFMALSQMFRQTFNAIIFRKKDTTSDFKMRNNNNTSK